MSVISTLITATATIHATDSLITELQPNGMLKALEWQKTKIVRVDHFRGAMSYWGLAVTTTGWNTLTWLQQQATRAARYRSPQLFAEAVAEDLNRELEKIDIMPQTSKGIGIHFSAYEQIDLSWVPELFLISNWLDTSYSALRPAGAGATRETYGWVSEQPPNPADANEERRLKVWQVLHDGVWLQCNNGDPRLFNLAANGIFGMANQLAIRGVLKQPSELKTLRGLARQPVKVISEIQREFCILGKQLVGGKIHDLAITPYGVYSSDSGDD